MGQHAQHRQALAQVFFDRIGAPQGQFAIAFAQHEEAGGMVDLPVHQHHTGNRGVAQCTARLQRAMAANLFEDVG